MKITKHIAFHLHRFRKPRDIILDVQLGAFYSIKDKDGYGVIRLLDLPGDSYHYQMMESTFPEPPSFQDVDKIKPFVLHVPMDIAAIIGKNISYIGHRILTSDDLSGYRVYLGAMGADKESIDKHFVQLITLSKAEPDRMRIYQDPEGVFADHLNNTLDD